jgi:putative tricarboxylic transport membrane protein
MSRLLLPTSIATLLLAAVAVIFVVGATRLGFWTDDGPGPGLLPFAAGVLLLPLLLVALRERVLDETPFRAAPLGAICLTCLYAAALPYLGFAPATVLLIIAWVRLFHGQGWVRAIALSIGLTAASIFLFETLLKVPMPLLPAWS